MDENILKFRVGIFVVIAFCILGILIWLNGETFTSQYTIYLKPARAPGVTKGTPIRKNGLLIGRVKDVQPDDIEGVVYIELGINDDSYIFENEVCMIGSESILGDTGIEVIAGDKETRGEIVRAGALHKNVDFKLDPIQSMMDLQPQLFETLEIMQEAGKSVDDAASQVGDISSILQKAFEDEGSEIKQLLANLNTMSEKGKNAMDNFDAVMSEASRFVNDETMRKRLAEFLTQIPVIVGEIRSTVTSAGEAIDDFKKIPNSFEPSLENLEEFTSLLNKEAPEIVASIKETSTNLNSVVNRANKLTASLEKFDPDQGLIGKILKDDGKSVDDAREAIDNIKEVSQKAVLLMNDLRIAGDKIARNPGGALINGALRPNKSEYKGTPGRDGGVRSPNHKFR
ncbi:MAG: phospholipid/cholesterol/gamma-HCH transport system substrate-binding protein [Mariniblastus sp.]|jgi:phospholipid/cholesterol/gamma-HCH transport system substrate-binding protein